MLYRSTRNDKQKLGFLAILLQGLADDGGLFVPCEIPKIDLSQLRESWKHEPNFVDTAFMITRKFISADEISDADLKDIVRKSYATFDTAKVTPLTPLAKRGSYLLELFHGPTFAFKDVALQMLGNLFEFALAKNAREGKTPTHLTIIGATSGDTGSAAIYGVRGKPSLHACILFPQGRVSPVQEAQMTSVITPEILNIAVEGTFDDCQDIVKRCFADSEFKEKLGAPANCIGAVNSINWARIMAQISYYFYSVHCLAHAGADPKVIFSVPTGNFGDALAGFYAWRMGLPVERVIAATNCNDILDRFMKSGEYSKKGQHAEASCSPAMDILVSSNFERLLYHAAGSLGAGFAASESSASDFDAAHASSCIREWMSSLSQHGKFSVPSAVLHRIVSIFSSASVSDAQTLETIKSYLENDPSLLVDPHTAVGLNAADRLCGATENTQVVCLSTAHPGKFAETIAKATGDKLKFEDFAPAQLKLLANLPKKKVKLCKQANISLLKTVQSVILASYKDKAELESIPGVTLC